MNLRGQRTSISIALLALSGTGSTIRARSPTA